jgi:hypothetical protein
MRGFVAILRREVFERRLLVLLALALGGIAVVLPLLPGFRPGGVALADLQGGLALGLALLLTVILAFFLGGSIVAGDLAERRLGFYFSRPLPGWAIWAGKTTAALALLFGGGILVLAPAALLGGNLNLDGIWGVGSVISVSGGGLLLTWALFLLFLVLATHAVSVIVRARSPWALLDLTALAVCGGLVWWTLRRLKFEGALFHTISWTLKLEDRLGIVAWMELGLAVAVLLALALAGALQVIQGRTDLRRAHRVLSQGLWGALLAAALLFMGLGAWVLSAGPGDLRGVTVATAGPDRPGEHWIALGGPAVRRPGYSPSFLYDLDSGRTVRARFGLLAYTNLYGTFDSMVRFSADGRRVVWLEFDGDPFNSPAVLYRLDLDRPGATPVRTPVSYKTPPRGFALSPDGRRVAAYEAFGTSLTVSEVDSGRLLAASLYVSRYETPRLAFAGPDRLRIFDMIFSAYIPGTVGTPIPVSEVDLTTQAPKPERTGEIPGMAGGVREWSLSPAGDRMLLRGVDALGLCDGRSGLPLAMLGSGRARGTFLRDGRIAVVETAPGDKYAHELRIFPPDGRAEPLRIPFPGTIGVTVADQPATGLLRVVTRRRGDASKLHELWQVDLERGTAKPLGTRRLAILEAPLLPQARVDLQGVDGVVWYEPWTSRSRVVLKGT